MLILSPNREQIKLFNQLIQQMDAQVVWNGNFVIMGDRLILEGFVRSLVFHFDIQKTEVSLVDLDADEDDALRMEQHPQLQDLVTLAIYTFAKWGLINCPSIAEDIGQLNQKLQKILSSYSLTGLFDADAIQFYKNGIRITYEDVVDTALTFQKMAETNLDVILPKPMLQLPVFPETAQGKSGGDAGAAVSESEEHAAAAERIDRYHSRLSVLDRLSQLQRKALRRDITYDKLLNDAQKKELLYPIDDYEAQLAAAANNPDAIRDSAAVAECIDKYHSRLSVLDRLSQLQRKALRRDITCDKLLNEKEKEELIYPIDDFECQEAKNLGIQMEGDGAAVAGMENGAENGHAGFAAVARDATAVAERIDKFHMRLSVLDRLSQLQRKALRRDITYDKLLNQNEKEGLLYPIDDFEYQEKMQEIDAEFQDTANRTYTHVQEVKKKFAREELTEKLQAAVNKKLQELSTQWGSMEVKQILDQTPAYVERGEFQELQEKLAPYEGIDMSPYKERLRQMREYMEIKEISNLLAQSPKKTRPDFIKLLHQIEAHAFAAETAAPYIENILDWVRDIDEAELKHLVQNVGKMNFDDAADRYEQIARGSFLPNLKADALAAVSKRLRQLRMDECGALAYSLSANLPDSIRQNPRYHFCPSDRIGKKATPAELKVMDNALYAYAKERGDFEYPIFMIDTSKDGDGQDGMLLTQENLFYGVRTSGYKVPLASIRAVYLMSGLLNSNRLIVEEANGVRHKVPHAVQAGEIQAWSQVFEKFIRYLRQRGVSEKLSYQAKPADEVQCGRCGCVYCGGDACPQCGYKNTGR